MTLVLRRARIEPDLSLQQTRPAVAALPRGYSSFLVQCYSRPSLEQPRSLARQGLHDRSEDGS